MRNPIVQFEAFIEKAKVFALISFYFFVCLFTAFLAALPLGAIFLGALMALAKDRDREATPVDSFRGDRLFFRYGEETSRFVLPIPADGDWTAEEVAQFSGRLSRGLAGAVRARLEGADSVRVDDDIQISDVSTNESKPFIKVQVRSKFGSTLTHFVHLASFGKTITAHYFTFVRGTVTRWETFKFVLASPFSIWFWGIPWLLNEHSILAQISRFRASSFDGIDIETMHSLTHQVIFGGTEEILKDAGLLSDEIRQVLHTHYHNTQSITVSRSASVVIGNVSQSTSIGEEKAA
jgi:hypothetical protein